MGVRDDSICSNYYDYSTGMKWTFMLLWEIYTGRKIKAFMCIAIHGERHENSLYINQHMCHAQIDLIFRYHTGHWDGILILNYMAIGI